MSQSSPTQTVLRRTLVAVVSGLALVGCAGQSSEPPVLEDTTAATETTSPSAPPPAETPTKEAPPPSTANGKVSPPGTTVALGEPATIPISSGTTKEGTASVTVRLEKGTAADLAPLKLGDRVKGMIPYYARITLEKVEGDELAFGEYSGDFDGRLPDGSPAGKLIASGWDKCRVASAPKEFDSGQSYETCRPFLASDASSVASVAYEGEYESEYNDDPVVWK